MNARMSADEYFMQMAHLAAQRSTCLRRKVGAVAVKDRHILATGYNGAPAGMKDCLQTGTCLREELCVPSGQRHELCRGVHSEQNVIIQAARHGVSLKGAVLYCTTHPCNICAKMLVNCGIVKVVYSDMYADASALEVMQESGMETMHYPLVRLEN